MRLLLVVAACGLLLSAPASADCGAPGLSLDRESLASGEPVVVEATGMVVGPCDDVATACDGPSAPRDPVPVTLVLETASGEVVLADLPALDWYRQLRLVVLPPDVPPGPAVLRAVHQGAVLAETRLTVTP